MTALALMDLLPRGRKAQARRLAFAGQDLRASGTAALRGTRMAMIFQEPMTALNPAYTIGDQLAEGFAITPGRRRRGARPAVHLL
jgi:peptide/nickel transport system ATP-binding protein